MTIEQLITHNPDEKPLENLVTDGGFCGIFRTIACVGDSLSSGVFESLNEKDEKGYHDMFEYSWGQYFARMAGCTVYNFSAGGMTARTYMDSFAQEKGYWDKDKAAQAYIIALGVNDLSTWRPDITPGDIDDIDLNDYRNNRDTFVGNYAAIIQRYKEIQPHAKFFLVTRPKTDETGEGKRFCELQSTLVKKIAPLFDNTYVIDLYEYAPVRDAQYGKEFWLGGHMSPAGYLALGKIMTSYVDYIIRHNMDDFKQVGFIGKDFYNKNYKR